VEGDFRVGDRLVIPGRNRIVRDGREVRVEPKAMGVLLHLARRPGEVAGRDELLQAVWPDTFVTDDALKRCISDLRKALDDHGAEFIETIPKRGYRLAAPVVREIDSSVAEEVARARRRRQVRVISLSAAAVIILLVGSGYAVVRNRRLAWAYGTALPEIQRLGENQDFDEAFRLIREAEHVIPSDARIVHLKRNFSRYPDIDSDPSGADVFVRGTEARRTGSLWAALR
jgi:DNA-binding winged helix-turn-helix (wHTH) protein